MTILVVITMTIGLIVISKTKMVTAVRGLNIFGIDATAFAKECKKR